MDDCVHGGTHGSLAVYPPAPRVSLQPRFYSGPQRSPFVGITIGDSEPDHALTSFTVLWLSKLTLD